MARNRFDVDENLETRLQNLYIIGDGSGVTHSLSHASASGVHVARHILGRMSAGVEGRD